MSHSWTWWKCVHSLKHKGKKLLYLFLGTSYSREEVWLLESEIQVFEFHNNCCAAVRNWPSSLSIFIISLGEISTQMPIKRGLMNQSCSISITLLPLFCDLRAMITSYAWCPQTLDISQNTVNIP